MAYNDLASIVCDAVNKGCLAALGASAVGVVLPPYVILLLLVLASASSTVLGHLSPVGTVSVPKVNS